MSEVCCSKCKVCYDPRYQSVLCPHGPINQLFSLLDIEAARRKIPKPENCLCPRTSIPRQLTSIEGTSVIGNWNPEIYEKLRTLGEQEVTIYYPDGTSDTEQGNFEEPVMIPESRWDRFKRRWFPEWLLSRFPPKTPAIEMTFRSFGKGKS